jgi:hypothetical protein
MTDELRPDARGGRTRLARRLGLKDAVVIGLGSMILGIHRVHPGEGQLAWDLGFLASGVALVGLGAWLIRGAAEQDAPRGASRDVAAHA